jgi:hypothetical protein
MDITFVTSAQSNEEAYELLKELEVSLDRLSEEYPDYKLQFNVFDSSIFIDIFSNKKEEQYPF